MIPNSTPPKGPGNGSQNADPLGGFVLGDSSGAPPNLLPTVVPERASVVGGGPIADLSYRNYDGPLHTRAIRWWTIARAGMRLTKAKTVGFWIIASLGALPYLIHGMVLFFVGQLPTGAPIDNPFIDTTPGQKYAFALCESLDWQLFMLLILTLIVGAGSIAGDNQSNALLVYLAKPITKTDYLVGKWVGIFGLIFLAAFIPGLLLFLYCMFSYWNQGFFKEEPLLILRLLAASAIPAAVFASVTVGISSWSRTPSMAGAIKAALYVVSTSLMWVGTGIYFQAHAKGDGPELLGAIATINVRHASESGVIMALVQNIYGLNFNIDVGGRMRGQAPIIMPPPTLWLFGTIGLLLCGLGIWAAYRRIRAVEVVTG